jgi:hypothetical protein
MEKSLHTNDLQKSEAISGVIEAAACSKTLVFVAESRQASRPVKRFSTKSTL